MNIWARYSSRQQDTKHHSTLYHIQNELALHGETGTLIQREGSCLLSRKQQMNNWRHNSTGYRMILLQVTATEWCAPTGAAVFTPCPVNSIPTASLAKLCERKPADKVLVFFCQRHSTLVPIPHCLWCCTPQKRHCLKESPSSSSRSSETHLLHFTDHLSI